MPGPRGNSPVLFYDEAPLELGDGAEDGEHHLTCQCAGVDLFRKRNKLCAEGGFAQLGCYSAQRGSYACKTGSSRSGPGRLRPLSGLQQAEMQHYAPMPLSTGTS